MTDEDAWAGKPTVLENAVASVGADGVGLARTVESGPFPSEAGREDVVPNHCDPLVARRAVSERPVRPRELNTDGVSPAIRVDDVNRLTELPGSGDPATHGPPPRPVGHRLSAECQVCDCPLWLRPAEAQGFVQGHRE